MNTYKIEIEGTVQGVGFRPFIYSLAARFNLKGSVLNGTQGVEIVINATSADLDNFLQAIKNELPPLASIDHIRTTELPLEQFQDFQIIATEDGGEKTVRIPPDVSICKACEKELFDPTDRRYGYPFITCTHCGVRYSIIYDLPYDRKNTSMKFFEMCEMCTKEYNDPLDRRYHAQPIGCYQCGPGLSLLDNQCSALSVKRSEIIDMASQLLLDGNILAVKGVGGYHLMCDATNEEAVAKLRERKRRPSKPFAVMVKNMDMAHQLAVISSKEEALLESKERPIVLLNAKRQTLNAHVAPNISRIGLFLPYTPLHLLLLHTLNRPLVATSANVTDEPICTDRESLEKLSDVYDYVLDHNRKIVNGCDDSVVMVVREQKVTLRRARGYAPSSVKLPFKLSKRVLSMGANQKSTVAIGFDDQVILSPHIGDLDSIGSVEYYKKNIGTLERIYGFEPEVIVHDKHPQYESTKVALSLSAQRSTLNAVAVQHHYAHILGVMAEKGIEGKVLGVAFDGTGYGDDGNLWGGEFLVCDYEGYERVAHLNYFKLLGGAKAIKEPRRMALSLLFELYGKEALALQHPVLDAFSPSELRTYYIAWEKGLNGPLSSSAGRLFDAVASLTDVCHVMSFEGESGMLLEELYDGSVEGYYPFGYDDGRIDILPMIKEIVKESDRTVAVSKFFHTLVEIIMTIHKAFGLPLVLSGGVFQNRILLNLMMERVPDIYFLNRFPPNDGGIALGQAAAILS
ncbi:carbamoyltransferase HypF [Sulfurovum sp. NBC37-1]|uniref:carbamoyltransferase HypF n=1 Tax=Sulfurovum sp. (strain NBC37-1) TaxID=387093 RepID=UPI0001587D1B|nr:carbamoyltransferase HypF [Sulfurovum sp. NBC37-1]BAF72608.1 hydrogenase maturation protein HypF [Sulfurovum sp. NBC37-1]